MRTFSSCGIHVAEWWTRLVVSDPTFWNGPDAADPPCGPATPFFDDDPPPLPPQPATAATDAATRSGRVKLRFDILISLAPWGDLAPSLTFRPSWPGPSPNCSPDPGVRPGP